MLGLAVALFLAGNPPDFDFFLQRIQPIFLKARQGAARCYNCHSLESNPARFHLEPTQPDGTWTVEQSRRNFENAVKLLDPAEPLKSRLLLHPLAEAAGGDPYHSGGKFWKSKKDPEWRRLSRWARGEKTKH